MSQPWTFEEARAAAHKASANQRASEDFVKEAHKQYAASEKAYRMALANKIIQLHSDGIAWSQCGDIARGDEHVAELRFKRDVAEGIKEAGTQAAWRNSADRRDTESFVAWSMRRELAEAA